MPRHYDGDSAAPPASICPEIFHIKSNRSIETMMIASIITLILVSSGRLSSAEPQVQSLESGSVSVGATRSPAQGAGQTPQALGHQQPSGGPRPAEWPINHLHPGALVGPTHARPLGAASSHDDRDDYRDDDHHHHQVRRDREQINSTASEHLRRWARSVGLGGGHGSQHQQHQTPLPHPKLVQWSKEAIQYYEGSTLVLTCSLAISWAPAGGQLKFAWFKQGKPLAPSSSSLISGNANGNQQQQQPLQQQQHRQLTIETLADYSFLRLADLRPADSGAYTCAVSNQLGQEDRTTAQVLVNVKLKWLPSTSRHLQAGDGDNNQTSRRLTMGTSGHELEVSRAGQPVVLECNGAGQPRPQVRWFRLGPRGAAKGGGGGSGAAAGKQFAGMPGDHHNQPNQQHPQSAASQKRMDEAQIRSALLQLDAPGGGGSGQSQLQRIELIPSAAAAASSSSNGYGGLVGPPTSDNQIASRWRLESSFGTSQHEIYSRLILDRAEPSASGLYECELTSGGGGQVSDDPMAAAATSGQQTLSTSAAAAADRLRKVFGLLVNADGYLDRFVQPSKYAETCLRHRKPPFFFSPWRREI